MGILRDIFDISRDMHVPIEDADELFEDEDGKPLAKYRPVSYDSIAKQAKNGTMMFPVICTRALSYDDAVMITKACERNFASMLQVVFTMNSVTNTDNPQEFINQYHQNMNTTVKGPGDIIGLVFNSYTPGIDMSPCNPGAMKALKEDSIPYATQFELKTINEKFSPVSVKSQLSMEGSAPQVERVNRIRGRYVTYEDVMEGRGGGRNPPNRPRGSLVGSIDARGVGADFNNFGDMNMRDSHDYHYHAAKGFNPYQQVKNGMVPENIFRDSDVKKANELVPTLMQVRILKDMGEDSKFIDFVAGVKAHLHPVKSEDFIDHLVSALKERGKLFRFLQWTTGEITFFKDLMFNIDQAKKDIREIRSGSETWWRALKNAKASRRFHKWTRTGPVLPNATFVVSIEEVDFIKANHGFDLLDNATALKILESYNILQFVVVDPSAEVVHFLIDGENRFNTMTYKGLERQQGEADKQFKEILRAVNKLQ